MIGKALNRRLEKGIFVSIIIGIIILSSGMFILNTMTKSLSEFTYEQMVKETEEYKKRILQQIDKDFQTLNTLAAFFSCRGVLEYSDFAECLHQSNQKNDFVTMAYFDIDGKGTLVNIEHGIWMNADYREMAEEAISVIEEAYEGKESFSQLFDSEVSRGRVFVYAVPVYKDGEIIGVLSASDYVEMFLGLFEGHNVMSGSGAAYLISTTGKILISTPWADPEISQDDFFHSSCISDTDRERIFQAVSEERSITAAISYHGKSYAMLLNPIGIQNWYVMLACDQKATSHTAYRMIHVVGVMFTMLLVVILALLVYICRMIAKNNRSLALLAYKDKLTGADNTDMFFLNLEQAREKRQGFTLAAINVHQFKFINEIFGTKAADHILCDIVETIGKAMKEGEFFCRDSADRFYIKLNEVQEEAAKIRLERLMKEISAKAVTSKMDYQIQMYAGASVWSGDDKDLELPTELLLTRVLFAKKYSRELPANQVHFYDADVHKGEEMQNYVETHMRQALAKGEFRLFLQPKVNLSDGSLHGAEALVRWITEEGRMIYPDSFIPQFERNGFCMNLDLYMVEQVCRQIREWMDAGREPIPVSINQSKLLFFDSDYLVNLKGIIEKYQISTSLITLEILEGLALDHAGETNAKIRRLKSMGFKVSMDDFGTGYSSLNTLGKLEINELKLDRSFLLETDGEQGSRFLQIMEHVVNLAKSMNITTVVEGVETEENEALIRRLGCDVGQGYLYSRPISAADFTKKYIEK